MPNKVYIVGAGPNSIELLTLKAHRLITEYAQVIIYDRLIGEDIISLIPDSVEKIYAGKSCKHHFMTQDEINEEIVKHALKDKKVVRLKGGDPFIFGRAGEEILELQKHDIPFEVVPGISAAAGIAAEYNIPLTHRAVAGSVIYLTGHKKDGEFAEINWEGVAHGETTLVIYMGLKNLSEIAQKLIQHGLDKTTPIMAVQDGTSKESKSVTTTLKKVNKINDYLTSPVTLFIGNVVTVLNGENNRTY